MRRDAVALGILVTLAAALSAAASTVDVPVGESWAGRASLSLSARLKSPSERDAEVLLYLQNSDGWWYQTCRTFMLNAKEPLPITLDVSPDSADWAPSGHKRPWDGYVVQRVTRLRLKAMPGSLYKGEIEVKDVACKGDLKPGRTELRDFQVMAPQASGADCWEISFNLNRAFDNPFDADSVSMLALIEAPDGSKKAIRGFFDQEYESKPDGGTRIFRPAGGPLWKFRFLPAALGEYRYEIALRSGGSTTTLAEGRFTVDRRLPSAKGTATFSGPFAVEIDRGGPLSVYKPAEKKWTQVTSKADALRLWSPHIEWRSCERGFRGLGRYNLERASEFEEVLRQVEQSGGSLPMVVPDFRVFGNEGPVCWYDAPLSTANGGPVTSPGSYARSPEAERLLKNLFAYCIARWGYSPAVSGWHLGWLSPGEFAESWHMRMAEFVAREDPLAKPIRSSHPQAAPFPNKKILNLALNETTGWMVDKRLSPEATVRPDPDEPGPLVIHAPFPGEVALRVLLEDDWSPYQSLVFEIYLPPGSKQHLRPLIYLKDGECWWYETLAKGDLSPGEWTKYVVDISGDSERWTPCGQQRPWSWRSTQRVRELGIRVFSTQKENAALRMKGVELWGDPARIVPPTLEIRDVKANADKVDRFAKFELTFNVPRMFSNPFDPAVIDITASFVSPGGRLTKAPAFFYADFDRRESEGKEVLVPKGNECWKIRFAPTEAGRYEYRITAKAGAETVVTPKMTFESLPGNRKGYVRKHPQNPLCFGFSTGEFFYPIGHSLSTPIDLRSCEKLGYPLPEKTGIFIYDNDLEKMSQSHENLTEIWMSSWWLAMEWRKDWGAYQGYGRYNLQNAWRLDYLLDMADGLNMYVHLVIDNHGKASTWCDQEWQNNPYNRAQGGFLDTPEEFFSDDRARALHKQVLRYIISRWGYSTRVFGFELWSEFNLTGSNGQAHRYPVMYEWHKEMSDYLRAVDYARHLVTTHYCSDYRAIDPQMAQLAEIEYLTGDAYRQPNERGAVIGLMRDGSQAMQAYEKPYIVTEFGGSPWADTHPALIADLHGALWSAFMTNMAGTPLFWWYQLVDKENLFPHYKAFAAFAAGEDRSNGPYMQSTAWVSTGSWNRQGDLEALALQKGDLAYVWIYDVGAMKLYPLGRPHLYPAGSVLTVNGLANDTYCVEFWDTLAGTVIQKLAAASLEQTLTVPIPAFACDVAVKVKLDPGFNRFASVNEGKAALERWRAWKRDREAEMSGLAAAMQASGARFSSPQGLQPVNDALRGWRALSGEWTAREGTVSAGGGGERLLVFEHLGTDGKGIALSADLKFDSEEGNAGLVLEFVDPRNYYVVAVRAATREREDWSKVQLYARKEGRYASSWKCEKEPDVPAGKWINAKIVWQGETLQCLLDGKEVLKVGGVKEESGMVGLRAGGETAVTFRNVRIARP